MPMKATMGAKGYGPFNFELKLLNGDGDVRNLPEIETASDAAGVTRWFRPEDGYWHPIASKDGSATFYFVTTSSFAHRTRMWRVMFKNIKDPLAGGTVTALVEGSELPEAGTPKMMDNLVATCDASVYLQEDPGNQDYIGRIWRYHPKDGLIWIAEHNPKYFQPGAPQQLTKDEESSGIIAADGLITNRRGQQCFIVNTQAHYEIAGELVQGAQLMLMCVNSNMPKFARKQSPIAT